MLTHVSSLPEALRKRILACQTEEDWDDEGATGITEASCEAALQFIEEVLKRDDSIPIPGVSPSSYGSVTLHWRHQDRHLIVRPSADTDLTYYRFESVKTVSEAGNASRNQVIERILKFFSADHAK